MKEKKSSVKILLFADYIDKLLIINGYGFIYFAWLYKRSSGNVHQKKKVKKNITKFINIVCEIKIKITFASLLQKKLKREIW